MAKVLLKGISKRFGAALAVDQMDLEIPDKQFVVLVGPSGCGKTTALRLIAGLEEPSAGEIYIGERRVNGVAPKDRDIAMVFQSYALYPHMDVYQNMAIGLRLRKLERDEIDRRVREAADQLGLAALLERKPAALSGGERQRVAIGRATVRKPAVFLFDEPLSNLDAKLRLRMRAELKQLHRRVQTTIVYVTHDQVEAMTLADQMVVMRRGLIVQRGAPLEVYNKPASLFVAGFIGAPSMNFLKVDVVKAGDEFCLRAEGVDIRLSQRQLPALAGWAGRQAILGVRPEHLTLGAPPSNGDVAGRLQGVIQIIEPLGGETLIHVAAGTQEIIASCSPAAASAVDSQVTLSAAIDKIHLFDPQSEAAII
jgi:multiple sugar transport system ATP-binding protein